MRDWLGRLALVLVVFAAVTVLWLGAVLTLIYW
jgi:hypothetical protein